jgi:hypothetical protein
MKVDFHSVFNDFRNQRKFVKFTDFLDNYKGDLHGTTDANAMPIETDRDKGDNDDTDTGRICPDDATGTEGSQLVFPGIFD